jgi:hypothetical protein
MRLPPPDPNEYLIAEPAGGRRMAAPTTVFAKGQPSRRGERVAGRILDLRPGVLIVLISD